MNESYVSREDQSRKLTYENEFKKFIHEHKAEHFLSRIKQLVKALIDTRDWLKLEIEDGDLKIKRFGDDLPLNSGYFHINFKGKEFFLRWRKRNTNKPIDNSYIYDPANEFSSTVEAREILKSIIGVEVVEPQYAYSSQTEHYFISLWQDLPLLSKVMQEFERSSQTSDPIYQSISERYERATDLLSQEGYKDLGIDQAFYDREKDTIVFFDLHRDPSNIR